jgi:ABC-type polysaccharide/polyol phosphate export permease
MTAHPEPTAPGAGPAAAAVYDSAERGPAALEELRALWRFADLIWLYIGGGLKTRYRRSALGVAWTLVNPLLTMLVLTVAFSALFHGNLERYPVYVLSGLLFWNFFSQSTTAAMRSFLSEGKLLQRVYVPRTTFAVAAVGTGIANWLIGLAPLAVIMLLLGHPWRPSLLYLPVAIVLGGMFALGTALILATLAVRYTDVVDIYEVLLRAAFFLTAVMYPASIIPARQAWLLALNPLYLLLEQFRTPIYSGQLPSAGHTLLAAGVAAGTLAAGWWLFTRSADELAYRT